MEGINYLIPLSFCHRIFIFIFFWIAILQGFVWLLVTLVNITNWDVGGQFRHIIDDPILSEYAHLTFLLEIVKVSQKLSEFAVVEMFDKAVLFPDRQFALIKQIIEFGINTLHSF